MLFRAVYFLLAEIYLISAEFVDIPVTPPLLGQMTDAWQEIPPEVSTHFN